MNARSRRNKRNQRSPSSLFQADTKPKNLVNIVDTLLKNIILINLSIINNNFSIRMLE